MNKRKADQVCVHGSVGVMSNTSWADIRRFMTGRSWLVPRLMTKEEYEALRDDGSHESFTEQRRRELSIFIHGWKMAKS